MARVLVDTVTTDVNGIAAFTNLPPGTYKYVQKSAPTGYTADSTEYTITVSSADKIEEDKTNAPAEVGSVTITKHVEGNSSLVLPGATFKLMDNAGKTMQSVSAASDSNGEIVFNNLMTITENPQSYKLLEVTPPANYDQNTTEYNPSVTVDTNTDQAIPNTPSVQGALDVSLVDTNYEEYTLTGSEYELYWVTEE